MSRLKFAFNITYRPQIESGEYKVETRDGRPARVICWDRTATEPYDNCNIVALVPGIKFKSESTYYYYQDGHLWNRANDEGDSVLDLFIITPEPELTEFEADVMVILLEFVEEVDTNDVKRISKELLELAKKNLTEIAQSKSPLSVTYANRCFENGKQAMKEQMMKDAVEGTVMDFSSNRPRPQVDVLLDPHKYHTGDKVRIIIVKEE